MDRRKFIAGLTTAGIGAGALASTMTASAQVEAGMFDVQEEYTVDTQSGRVESITLENINVTASWENFDNPATTVEWMLEVTRNAPGMSAESEQLATKSVEVSEPDFDGSESTTLPDQDLVEAFGEGSFNAPSEVPNPGYGDGGEITETFDVSFGLRATVTDSEGNSHSQYVGGSTDLGINNQRADVGAGGEGDLSAEEAEAEEPTSDYGPAEGDAGTLSATVQGEQLRIDTSGLQKAASAFSEAEDEVAVFLTRQDDSLDEVKYIQDGFDPNPNGRGSLDGDTIVIDVNGYKGFAATASLVVGAEKNTVQTNLSANGAKAWEDGARFEL